MCEQLDEKYHHPSSLRERPPPFEWRPLEPPRPTQPDQLCLTRRRVLEAAPRPSNESPPARAYVRTRPGSSPELSVQYS